MHNVKLNLELFYATVSLALLVKEFAHMNKNFQEIPCVFAFVIIEPKFTSSEK